MQRRRPSLYACVSIAGLATLLCKRLAHHALASTRDLKFIVGETGADTEAYESRSPSTLHAEESLHQLGDAHRSG